LDKTFITCNNHTLSTIFGQDLMQARALKQRLAHMTELVLGCLSK
jgi:Tetracyclin repressor-like, C-terminal domain